MSTTISINIPSPVVNGYPGGSRLMKRQIKSLILKSDMDGVINRGDDPACDGMIEKLVFSDMQAASIAEKAERSGLAVEEWCRAVLLLGNKTSKNAETKTKTQSLNNTWMRKDQRQVYESIVFALSNSKIGMVQAGTGIGKTRAFLAAAVTATSQQKKVCVIAFPTVATLAHAINEITLLERDEQIKISFTAALGASQYVSETRLKMALTENDLNIDAQELARLEHWVDSDGEPITRASKAIGRQWLIEDLLELAPSATQEEINAVALSYDEATNFSLFNREDGGAKSYNDAKNSLKENSHNIVMVTHAMLGCHLLSGNVESAVLPKIDCLIVDEAHLLEGNIANVMMTKLSLHAMRRRLNLVAAKSARKAIKTTLNALESSIKSALDDGSKGQSERFLFPGDKDGNTILPIKTLLGDLLDLSKNALRHATKTKNKSPLPPNVIRLLKNDVRDLNKLVDGKEKIKIQGKEKKVAYSPPLLLTRTEKKEYISVSTGPVSVRFFLERLFTQTPSGALCSASMAILDHSGWNYSYMTNMLGIPKDKVEISPSVFPSWATSIPTMYTSSNMDWERKTKELMVGKRVVKVNDYSFLDTMMRFVMDTVVPNARGGIIILATSYEMVNEIAARLIDLGGGDFEKSLIIQKQGVPLGKYKTEFLAANRSNGDRCAHQPIWVATGAAWTGLDIKGINSDGSVMDPSYDFALTDLIIPCCQTSLSRTTAFAVRSKSRFGWNYTKYEAFFATMQGIGRLMRRDGVLHRNIWLLDPRLYSAKAKSWISPIYRFTQTFAKKKRV